MYVYTWGVPKIRIASNTSAAPGKLALVPSNTKLWVLVAAQKRLVLLTTSGEVKFK